MVRCSAITGWGKYAPARVVTNDDLAQRLDTSDEWIRERTGIRERRFVEDHESTATMSTACSRDALERAGIEAKNLDLILVATSSPDHLTPPVSSEVQHALGATGVGAMQITVGCTGFVYALVTAEQFIASGTCDNVLVIGAELTSRWLDMDDRSTAILFGDGAAAVVLQATDEPCGVLSHVLGSDGSGAEHLKLPAGGVKMPITREVIDQGLNAVVMNGREVFKFATTIMGTALDEVLEKAGITADQVDLFIPHQANKRIIDYAAKRANIPAEKVIVNVDRYGNTSAASVALALAEAFEDGLVKPGAIIAMVAFGAGLTWAAVIYKMPGAGA